MSGAVVLHRVRPAGDGGAVCSCGERLPVAAGESVESVGTAHLHSLPRAPRPSVVVAEAGPPADRVPAVGVAGAGGLWAVDAGGVRRVTVEGWRPVSVAALAAAALAAGLREVLVTAECLAAVGMPADVEPRRWPASGAYDGTPAEWWPEWMRAGEVSWWASWRARVKPGASAHRCWLVFLPYRSDPVGPWGEAGSVRALCEGLSAFHRATGVPWADSVGRTVERLILAGHPKEKGGVRLDVAPVLPSAYGGEPKELEAAHRVWCRQLTVEEARAGWVHSFDANAQYLGAWQGAELGFGEPAHVGAVTFSKSTPGLWRVEGLPAGHPVAPAVLPPPWGSGGWYATPTLARAQELGVAVEVVEAWLWPRRSRFLAPAGVALRDARAQLAGEAGPAAALALAAVKDCYARGTGRLGMPLREERSGWRRPDWGDTVRALARVNLDRRLCKLTARPFAIATDGLVFATDVADPVEFAAAIGLPLGAGLGEYTAELSAPLSSELRRKIAAARDSGAVLRAMAAEGAL